MDFVDDYKRLCDLRILFGWATFVDLGIKFANSIPE